MGNLVVYPSPLKTGFRGISQRKAGKSFIPLLLAWFCLTLLTGFTGGLPAIGQQPENTPTPIPPVTVYYDREAFTNQTQWMSVNQLNFDELQQGTTLGSETYTASYGISFTGSPENPIITSKVNGAYPASSAPNLLMISSPVPNQPAVFEGHFSQPSVFFGFTLIGISDQVSVTVTVLDGNGNPLQDVSIQYPPPAGNEPSNRVFAGIMSNSYTATIGGFRLTQVKTMGIQLALGLDDFFTGNQPVSLMLSMAPESFDYYRGGLSSRTINFDELQPSSRLQDEQYLASHGIRFTCNPENFILTNKVNGYASPSSQPNMVMVASPNLDQPAVFEGTFQQPVPFFAFKLIGLTDQVTVTLTVYDRNKKVIQEYPIYYAPMSPSAGGSTEQTFIGIAAMNTAPAIGGFKLTHIKSAGTQLAMGLDDLIVPGTEPAAPTPTEAAMITPSAQPTATFTPTVTPTSTPTGAMVYLMNASSPDVFNAFTNNSSSQTLNFDELQQGTTLKSDVYTASFGISFTGTPENPIITGKVNGYAQAASLPNLLMISSPNLDQPATFDVKFAKPLPFFAFTLIALTDQVWVMLDVYDTQGKVIQSMPVIHVPPSTSSGLTADQSFVGISALDLAPVIGGFRITQTKIMGAQLALGFDNLIIPGTGATQPTSTSTAMPIFTVIPSTPTSTTAPTDKPTPTSTAAPTLATVLPTPTRTAAPTAVPTSTSTTIPTRTAAPTQTAVPTSAPFLPTPTRTAVPTSEPVLPTATRTAAPVFTPALPTPTMTEQPTLTPMPTATETTKYEPTNTPEQEPTLIETYEFDQENLNSNGLAEIPGGFIPNTPAGTVDYVNFSDDFFSSSEDNKGLRITVKPGQVSFLYTHFPVTTKGAPVLLRLTVRADNPWATAALVALRGNLGLSQNVDGSIAMNNPATTQSFIEGEKRLILVYEPDQGQEFTPAFQIANLSKDSKQPVQVWIDKLEILKLDAKYFGAQPQGRITKPTPTSNNTKPSPTSIFARVSPTPIFGKPSPTPTSAVAKPSPTPTATPTKYIPPKLGWIPFGKDENTGKAPFSVMKEETSKGLLLNFDIPGMYADEVFANGDYYHKLRIPGHTETQGTGKPALPIVGQMVEIPLGVNVEVEIYKSNFITLPHYNVIPAQEPEIRTEDVYGGLVPDIPVEFVKDPQVYSVNTFYPNKLAGFEAKDIGIIRGHRVLFIKVYPVQFNPSTREIQAYSNIEVRLKYDKYAQTQPVEARKLSAGFESMLKDSVVNLKDVIRYSGKQETIDKLGDGCDYLILTTDQYMTPNNDTNPLRQLKRWKEQKGFITKIVSVSKMNGGLTADNLKAYIKTAYDTWSPAPSYILLVGDADTMPTNYQTTHPSHAHNDTLTPSDLYYTTVDGEDYFPDLYCGRLSVDTVDQLRIVVNKILDYEKTPPDNPAFYQTTSLVNLFEDKNHRRDDPHPEDGQEDTSFRIIENAQDIYHFLLQHPYTAERIYNRSSSAFAPKEYENGSAIPAEITLAGDPAHGIPAFPWTGNRANITAAFNAGRFLVTYDAHGGRGGWGLPSYSKADVRNLTNGKLTPVVFSLACMTGWFDNETDARDISSADGIQETTIADECFSEELLRKENGGAVAVFASTRISWDQNDFMFPGLYKAIWPEFEPNPPVDFALPQINSSPLHSLGQITTFSKIYMANIYEESINRQVTFEMYTLFGDPEMTMRTGQPDQFSVLCPQAIGSAGLQEFVITVRNEKTNELVPNAEVTITTPAGILARSKTNAYGFAIFPINGILAGEVTLTVSAPNYKPLEKAIPVTAIGAVLETFSPDNGPAGTQIALSGRLFQGNEDVTISFITPNAPAAITARCLNGSFGLAGMAQVSLRVPDLPLGPVTVFAKGKVSNRAACRVFTVRKENPVDLYSYNQHDESTWHLNPGRNPVWNNPEIQLYDKDGNAVESNNLQVGVTYRIEAKIHNDTAFAAQNAKITFEWAQYGVGQSGPQWTPINEVPLNINVAGNSIQTARMDWTPAITGHVCIRMKIDHIEDINTDNNVAQENCHVGTAASPSEATFLVWNPTDKPAYMFLELAQIFPREQTTYFRYWDPKIVQPDPQLLQPGEKREVKVIVDPDPAQAKSGEKAEFALTGFINGKVIGGVNMIIKKK